VDHALTGKVPTSRFDSVDAPEQHEGEGRKGSASDEPTEAQLALLAKLAHQKLATTDDPEGAAALAAIIEAAGGRWSKREASKVIDGLMMKRDVVVTAPRAPARTNRYEGACAACGQIVPAGEGSLTQERGQWITRHHPECPPVAVQEATPEPADLVPGAVYQPQPDRFVRVHEGRNGGRLYGKVWDGHGFDYQPGSLTGCAPENRVTAEQAAAFGHATGCCCFCSRTLTDDRSLVVGYGPTCATKHGLPWGT
jgi:hypothetical protein